MQFSSSHFPNSSKFSYKTKRHLNCKLLRESATNPNGRIFLLLSKLGCCLFRFNHVVGHAQRLGRLAVSTLGQAGRKDDSFRFSGVLQCGFSAQNIFLFSRSSLILGSPVSAHRFGTDGFLEVMFFMDGKSKCL